MLTHPTLDQLRALKLDDHSSRARRRPAPARHCRSRSRKPSEHQRRLRSSTAMRPSCRLSTPPAWRSKEERRQDSQLRHRKFIVP
jgi:hypothetical protein